MAEKDNRALTLTREYDAPRELVFKAWVDKDLIAKWWGPEGFTSRVNELDVRPGGAIHIVMIDTEGLIEKDGQFPMVGNFQEIVEPERLVFASSAVINDKPVLDTVTTVTFEDVSGKTKITVQVEVTRTTPEAEDALAGMEMGWSQQLDMLTDLLKAPSVA